MKKIVWIICIISLALYTTFTSAQQKAPQNTQPQSKSIADGYGNVKWGSTYNDVKPNVVGRIAFTDEKRIIVSKDQELEYRYGFFYPEINQEANQQPKLFYVVIQFPYISLDDMKKKMEEKYGPPTGESIKNNQGAYIWESESTSIIVWVDSYEKKPFCRKITYLSKVMAKDINAYHNLVFSKKEQEILKQLQP
ncbi:MAG: hypothetical protein AB1444_11795 [Spirochaetota bacterium]